MKGEDERRRASWGARLLALGALVASVAVVIMVVSASVGSSEEEDPEGSPNRAGRTVEGCTPSEPGALRDGYYVVQPGEPGLSAVSDKTCVPMDRLLRLNENLDPQLIPQGACVNLRRNGCRTLAEG
jgi:hypothetical protein